MENITFGLTSELNSDHDEEVEDYVSNLKEHNVGEVTISHSGRKYVVRKTARKQITELGR
jgi:hemin uptake protein HemP